VMAPADPVSITTPLTVSANYSDIDLGDTHTATINWGDGITTAGVVTKLDPATNSGTVTGSHSYATPGVYTITVTITDSGSPSLSASSTTTQYVVIYDPSGGFVTGGGFINSPAGASVQFPLAVGRANFGFVSRYQKGAKIPTGETEFQFKAGNLNFHSTLYQWLVVAGARAQYKGEGTINGSGRYGFLLTAIDGQVSGGGGVDKFRIKIWDMNSGDAVVYNNEMLSTDDAAPTTAISGGSIVIHEAPGRK